eukprot:TRINITY_DN5683_c0_g1_i1.p1 TRINITY_DN5683_c0_g1~~TRINITY_DN5683_c0_g1_i1.p1  ORF type:complete len:368 (+),score=87.02 TRINITY_DN5683_c0_g1_i1:214-1317(+)
MEATDTSARAAMRGFGRASSSSSSSSGARPVGSVYSASSPLLSLLPRELFEEITLGLMDCAAPLGRLASASSRMAAALKDPRGRLRVGSLRTGSLESLRASFEAACWSDLRVLQVDLTAEKRPRLARPTVEDAIRGLGDALAEASSLRSMTVRLAPFDVAMERLRLGKDAWEALTCGLSSLAKHRRLGSLELSNMCIKSSTATQEVALRGSASADERCRQVPSSFFASHGEKDETDKCAEKAEDVAGKAITGGSRGTRCLRRASTAPSSPAPRDAASARLDSAPAETSASPLTFLSALGQLTSLEDLALMHNEIFSSTALLLPPVLAKLPRLKTVNLHRNFISKQAARGIRDSAEWSARKKLAWYYL